METVARACKNLMIKQPFYGLFLCGINKRFAKVGTACVGLEGINTVLRIDPEYWKGLNDNRRMATIMHETGHIMFYHVSDYKYWCGVCPDHTILNIAMDMTIESNIPEEWWDEKGIVAEDLFREFPTLSKGQGTHFYIKFLQLLRQKCGLDPQQNQSGQGNSDQSGSGQGQSNSSQPSEQDYQNALDSFDKKSKAKQDHIKDMLTTMADAHKSFEEFMNSLTDSQRELVKSQIEYQLKETARNTSRGLWPGGMTDELDRLLTPKPAVYDWKKAFRRILGTAFDVNRKLTRRKESKRFDDAYGSKLKKKHKILVGIDTSGSVSDKDFEDFFSEIYHIYKAGSQVHVLECDTEITNEYDYNGKMPSKVTGRGGTIMKPLYDYWNASKEYTLFVLFTDGYCDSPEFLKGNTISIITTDGAPIDKFPGKTIKINR